MAKRNTAGCRLLRVAIEKDKWDEIAKEGFKATDFSEDSRILYRWIDKYIIGYQSVPSVELVETETGITLPGSCEWDYAVEQFRDYLLRTQIKDRLNDIKQDLNLGNTKAAAGHFQPIEVRNNDIITFGETRQEVFDSYQERKLKGIAGIDIPWPSLANSFLRWENQTLNVFLAPSNQGKTWLSCYIAHHCMSAGKKVLFISMENTIDSIQRRLTSIHYTIPFRDMRTSQADLRLEKKWQNLIKGETLLGDILLFDRKQVRTVADISSLNLTEKPDLVIVDGAYLLKGRGGTNWESSAQVLGELQLCPKLGVAPWLCSSQLNPVKKKNATGHELGFEARYAKEWMLNPDTSFILLQTADDMLYNRAKLQVAKIREAGDMAGNNTEFFIHMNRTRMDFSEMPSDSSYDIDY